MINAEAIVKFFDIIRGNIVLKIIDINALIKVIDKKLKKGQEIYEKMEQSKNINKNKGI